MQKQPPTTHLPQNERKLHPRLVAWLKTEGIKPFAFQHEAWTAIGDGKSGLLNAPTGSGKTYAILLGLVNKVLHERRDKAKGLQVLWITPLRALAKDFYRTTEKVMGALLPDWQVGMRMGDTSTKDRAAQKKAMPQFLITTPESLQLLIGQKGTAALFGSLDYAIIDEWHELLGGKRGVQVELGLSYLRCLKKDKPLITWGISATIGNMEEAAEVILGVGNGTGVAAHTILRADIAKKYAVHTVMPDEIENFPWSGHLGLNMIDKVLPIIAEARSTLLFTNTRGQAEMWYQALINKMPELAGQSALHHGSLESAIRTWVEDALRDGRMKLVVCTSSLDLGVDFAPVDRVIQIGSPKGIGRLLQRAGRSGHQPGAVSEIFLVPTQSLEIIEFEALKYGLEHKDIESKPPIYNPMDVLLQFLTTMAIGDGFAREQALRILRGTFAFKYLSEEALDWAIFFLMTGGESLSQYDEYSKIVLNEGRYVVENKRVALRQRMSIGTIVGSQSLRIKYISGGYLGSVEEYFVSTLNPGDAFWFGGRSLEFIQVKGLDMLVRASKSKKGAVPSWAGGRMPLSSNLSTLLRKFVGTAAQNTNEESPLAAMQGLLAIQSAWSALPTEGEFLIESLVDRDGTHLFFYPFEGRFIHEILGALIAFRIAQHQESTFSIAMNDYGFELLTESRIDIEEVLSLDLFSTKNLKADLEQSINKTDLAKKRFREIATIAGLIFRGMPGQRVKDRHLQSNSNLVYDALTAYEPDNLLVRQALDEVFNFDVGEGRMVQCLQRINSQKILWKALAKPTPFSFPIYTDRLRGKLVGESLETRIGKMVLQLQRDVEATPGMEGRNAGEGKERKGTGRKKKSIAGAK